MSALDHEPFPKGAFFALTGLLALALVGTTAFRLTHLNGPPPIRLATSDAPVRSVDLSFEDQANGSVLVRENHTGALLETLAPNTNGFIRGVLRGLAHDRMRRHLDAAPPFRLAQTADGRISLLDTATGRRIDLESFGTGNRADFAKLLGLGAGRRA